MFRYMIHTCNNRYWYVHDYLIPSMLKQGIPKEDIVVYLDKYNEGNLTSCMHSFHSLPSRDNVWHLQDDVVISRDFKSKIEQCESLDSFLICGFCSNVDSNKDKIVSEIKKTGT